jgi:hypothetical protein
MPVRKGMHQGPDTRIRRARPHPNGPQYAFEYDDNRCKGLPELSPPQFAPGWTQQKVYFIKHL